MYTYTRLYMCLYTCMCRDRGQQVSASLSCLQRKAQSMPRTQKKPSMAKNFKNNSFERGETALVSVAVVIKLA